MNDKKHVFISYATKDAAFVNRLREELARQNIPYWIDKEGLRPGTINWEKGIRQALRDAFAVIYVVTPASYASDNVQGEIAIADVEGCTIYPVWADGERWYDCVPIDKVKTQYIDMKGNNYKRNRDLLFNTLRGKQPELAIPPISFAVLPTSTVLRNPYKGLNAFTEKDVTDFFGRESLVDELLEAIDSCIKDSKDHLLTIIGASGSGKSSVVMAGLLPKLKVGALLGSDQWTYLKPMVPGDHPVQSLANILYSAPGRPLSTSVIDDDLKRNNGIGLLTTAEQFTKQPIVLYIDQFEELFMTSVSEDERQQFINLLIVAITQTDSPILVILTLRADFYDRPMNYPELGRLVQAYNRSVLPMSIANLRDTVEKPAFAAGLTFEYGLVADIIFDLRDDKNAQAGALPLLQYTLEQLYERRSDRILTAVAYQTIGGVKGAIGAHAEEVFKTLDEEAQNAFPRIFQALIHIDEHDIPTRKREIEAVLTNTPPSTRLVEALIRRARVLRVYTEKLGDTPYIEVTHEALLTSWERLAKWIKSANNNIRLIQEMKAAAARWLMEGKPKHRLWSHELLSPIYQALEVLPQDLIANEKEFIRPEAERLFEDFKDASEYIQLTLIERDFMRIGSTSIPILINAYGYSKNDIKRKIVNLLWNYPYDISLALEISLTENNAQIRTSAAQIIGELFLYKLSNKLHPALNDNDVSVRDAANEALAAINNIRIQRVVSPILQEKVIPNLSTLSTSAYELEEVRDINKVPELLRLLNEGGWKERETAARTLGEIGDARAVSDLLHMLKKGGWAERAVAAWALGQIGDPKAVTELLLAHKDEDDVVRQNAVVALGKIGDVRAIPDLLHMLKKGAWAERMAAVEALGEIGDSEAVPELLLALKDGAGREAVVASLRKIGDIPGLLLALKDENVEVRKIATELLGETKDAKVMSGLLLALKDEDVEVQKTAAASLGEIGDVSAIPELIIALKNTEVAVQAAAAASLGEIGDVSVIPELIIALKNTEVAVQTAAAKALGKIGDARVVPELLEALEETIWSIQWAAAEALGQIGDVRAVPKLLKLLKQEPLREVWANALGQIKDAKTVPELIKALQTGDIDVRTTVVEVLGKIKLSQSIVSLIELLDHPFGQIVNAARQALELMDTPESRAALAEYDAKPKG